jgi:hypothetical protein
VQVDRFIYARQTQGGELVGGGNRIAKAADVRGERTIGPLDAGGRLARQAIVRTPQGIRLAWYWYRVAGVNTATPAKAKVLELAAFVGRTAPSELVVVSTPCSAADCEAAARALFSVITGRELDAATGAADPP